MGLAGAFDFFGTSRLWEGTNYYRVKDLEPNDANAVAIYGDWCAIGRDLHHAVDDFERSELDHVEA